jgi:protein O-mannosyl-transferase
MKKILLLIAMIFLLTFNTWGQNPNPRILGVVMGISKYQNVPSLKYADRDAMSFYNFLLSPAGGAADTNNIRLLLNEKATSYNFFEAMDNLLDMAKEGDQVYIYFAGHGDIEKKTDRQNGFLIGSNAPANCYAAGGCIGVKYLQDYVETLVATKKSKVTMIIDACRSGKLAGGSQGAEITALALQAEWKGVTKILSCQPGETSLEGEQWGGGAGVFTFFMLKGMLGQADENGDGKVSAMELGTYLDKIVMKETHEKQLPEIVGDRRQDIARVNKNYALGVLNQMEKPISLPPDKQSAGFEIDKSSIDDISVLKEYEKFKYYIKNNNLLAYNNADTNKETALSIYRSLENSRSAQPIITKMKRELIAALQNKAQTILNAEVEGFTINDVQYCQDAEKEINAAFKLTDSSDSQYNQIKYKYLFFNSSHEEDSQTKIKLLEECIKINPDEPFAYNQLGYVLITNLKKYDKAIIYLDKAIELSKNWSWAWGNKGSALANMGKNEEALKCFDKAIELKPDFADAWVNKGNVLLSLEKNEEAIKCYDKAIELKPDYANAWYGKGQVLINLGKPEEAIKYYNKAIELKSDYAEAWGNKGAVLDNLGKIEEALKCDDKAIELNPNYAEAWGNKGTIFGRLYKYDEALKFFDKAIELKPDYADAWLNKGYSLFQMGKNEEALKCFDKAIELKPDNAGAWGQKGVILCDRLGKPEEAIKCFDKFLELKPDIAEVWANKGIAFSKLDKYDDAIKCYDKALEINPGFQLISYNKACTYSLMKNKPEMLKNLKKAIELNPQFKTDAPKDEDFKEYWNDPDFMELVK